MEIMKIAGFVGIAVMVVTLLKQYIPAYSVLALIACTVVCLGMFIQFAQPMLQWLTALTAYVEREEFQCLLKAAGIALIAQMAQELCKDAGVNSLGTAVELAGRCLVLAAAMPMFQTIIERFLTILR